MFHSESVVRFQRFGKMLYAGGASVLGAEVAAVHAKAQSIQGDIVEIVRKVFAIDGMSLVITIVYTNVL